MIHTKKDTGDAQLVIDHVLVTKLKAEQTGNAYALGEIIVPPGSSPPLHSHEPQETFYVIEGSFVFQTLENNELKEIIAEAGDVIHVSSNEVHTFKNVGEVTGKLLGLVQPTGMEKFFEKIGTPYHGGPIIAKKPSIFQMLKIGLVARKFGIKFVKAPKKK
jgi:quercetin dioxygenase-like cupin family protein